MTFDAPKRILLISFLIAFSLYTQASEKRQINTTLYGFHKAAKQANAEQYFDYLSKDAIVFGTDPSERWGVSALKAYTKPLFDSGEGWELVSKQRNIQIAPGKTVAWFDEMLDSSFLGKCRATGVLTKQQGEWKIAQYHLAIPLPNKISKDVIKQIHGLEKAPDS